MSIHNKIRIMRELHQWSQEEMAERINMSASGYAKLERGETKLNIDKLQKIAQVLNVNIQELISADDKIIFFMSGQSVNGNHTTYYANATETLTLENEKLKLNVVHLQEMLAQKNQEITALKEIIKLLKQNRNETSV